MTKRKQHKFIIVYDVSLNARISIYIDFKLMKKYPSQFWKIYNPDYTSALCYKANKFKKQFSQYVDKNTGKIYDQYKKWKVTEDISIDPGIYIPQKYFENILDSDISAMNKTMKFAEIFKCNVYNVYNYYISDTTLEYKLSKFQTPQDFNKCLELLHSHLLV